PAEDSCQETSCRSGATARQAFVMACGLQNVRFRHELFRCGTADSWPLNLFEYRAQTPSSRRINRLHESHASSEGRPKMRMRFKILTLGAQANAIGQCGFQAIVIGSPDIHMVVGDQSGQVLPASLPHDARLAMVDLETFFHKDGRDMNREAL